MKSKISFFNKTIFTKNITRFWPIWVSYLLVCLYRLPVRLFIALSSPQPEELERDAFLLDQLKSTVAEALQPSFFFLFACITAVAVFSYLYQARSTNAIHALPVCRESLFISNILSGILFLVVPQVIAFLASIFVCFLQRMTQLTYLLHWLVLSAGIVMFAFALAVFVVMITGNMIAVPVFYIVINYGFIVCRNMVSDLVKWISYGIGQDDLEFGSFLSPFCRIGQLFSGKEFDIYHVFRKIDGWQDFPLREAYHCIGGYCAAVLPIFLLAFFLYKRKQLETAGDVVAVPFLTPLVRWIVAFCFGVFLALSVQRLIARDNIFRVSLPLIMIFMATGGMLVFFLSEMLLKKKIHVFCRKIFVECGIFVALSLLFVVAVELNFLGIETRIPKENEIQSVYLADPYPIVVNTEDFSRVLEIHQSLIDSKKEMEAYFDKYGTDGEYTTLTLKYALKNGKILSRYYYIPVADYYLEKEDYVYHKLIGLSENPEYYLRYHFTDAYESITFVEGSVDYYMDESPYMRTAELNQEQCIRVSKAFKRDMKEGHYHPYHYGLDESYPELCLVFSYQVPVGASYPGHFDEGLEIDWNELQSTSIYLNETCVYTLDLLVELGILDESYQMLPR